MQLYSIQAKTVTGSRNAPHSRAASAKGTTKPEALSNIKEAIGNWLETGKLMGS